MKRIAIIVAAGRGVRFGSKKQFLIIGGKPLYFYSIKAFEDIVDKIILVIPKEDINRVESYGATVVAGGLNRYDSVYAGLRLCERDSLVAIHDAARPLVTKDIIIKTYVAAEKYGAAVPVTPITDTIRTVNGDLIDRNRLRAIQTPQTFKFDIVKQSYDKLFYEKRMEGITDDAEVVYRATGLKAEFIESDMRNRKITTPSDLECLNI